MKYRILWCSVYVGGGVRGVTLVLSNNSIFTQLYKTNNPHILVLNTVVLAIAMTMVNSDHPFWGGEVLNYTMFESYIQPCNHMYYEPYYMNPMPCMWQTSCDWSLLPTQSSILIPSVDNHPMIQTLVIFRAIRKLMYSKEGLEWPM